MPIAAAKAAADKKLQRRGATGRARLDASLGGHLHESHPILKAAEGVDAPSTAALTYNADGDASDRKKEWDGSHDWSTRKHIAVFAVFMTGLWTAAYLITSLMIESGSETWFIEGTFKRDIGFYWIAYAAC